MTIEWQKVHGGELYDFSTTVRPSGNGYVLAGTISGGGGSIDVLVAGLSHDGNISWGSGHGGTSFEFVNGLVVKQDGSSYTICVSGSYASGDKTASNPGTWLLKLDGSGVKVWDMEVGRYAYDGRIADSAGDGVIVGLSVLGADLTVIGPVATRGRYLDAFVTKLDSAGSAVWSFQGHVAPTNRVTFLSETRDGGVIVGGNAPVPESQWRYDYFLMKLDSRGGFQWGRTYGGISNENFRVVRETADGGFLVIGESDSPTSNAKTSPEYGGPDCWIVKVDAQGTKLWDKTYGGSGSEQMYDLVLLADGGFVAAGGSDSTNGTKTAPNFGGMDGWLLRCDANGNKIWEQSLGGDQLDGVFSFAQTPDGGFIAGLDSLSGATGNKSVAGIGFSDFWLVKLAPEPPLLHWERCCSTNASVGWNLIIQGTSNSTYRLEASTDLINWTAVQTNRLPGPTLELRRNETLERQRLFYRARVLQ